MNRMLNKALRWTLAGAIVVCTAPVRAQDAPPAPDPNAAIDALVKTDPAALAARVKALKDEAAAQKDEAAKLRASADELDAKAKGLLDGMEALVKQVAVLAAALGVPAPAPAEEKKEMAAAAPAPAPAPEMMAAVAEKKDFTNFDEHVKPIFQAKCARCHNDDTKKGGLSLASHATALAGGGSGPVITAGDPSASRLLKLINFEEEPHMPPSGDKLPDDQIALIRKWVEEGALQNAGSTPLAMKKADAPAAPAQAFNAAEVVDGPPPMPEVTLAAAKRLPTRGVVARAVDTSPRSPLVAVGGDKEVVLYNLNTFECLGALPFPEGDIFQISFSVNGELLVAAGGEEGNSGIAVVWNVRKGERMGAFGEAYDSVLTADLSPDHKLIATGGPDKKVHVYSTEDGKEVYKIDVHTDWVLSVKFTPDGEVLATADRQGGLFLWQAKNGRAVEQLKGHEGAIYALKYTPDSNYLVSAGQDGTVQEWDTWKYTRVRSFKAHNAPVTNVDVAPDGTIVTTSNDHTTKAWQFDGKALRDFAGLTDWGYQARFGEGGKVVLAGTWTGDILCWKSDTGELIKTLNTNPAS